MSGGYYLYPTNNHYWNDDTSPYPTVPHRNQPIKPTTRSTTKVTTAAQQRKMHEADIALIAKKMKELATQYGYCDHFTNAVEDLNDELAVKIDLNVRTSGVLRFAVSVNFANVLLMEDGEEITDELWDEIRSAVVDVVTMAVNDSEEDATLVNTGPVEVEYIGFDADKVKRPNIRLR